MGDLFEVSQRGPVTVIAPRASLDRAKAEAVQAETDGLLAAGQLKLVVDLSGVEYIDSSGLGTLVNVAKAVRDAGGQLCVCGASARVRTILEVVQLDDYLDCRASLDDAVRHLS